MTTLTSKQIIKMMTGSDAWRVTGVFGEMAPPRTRPHDGTDYAVDSGTKLVVPADAVVTSELYGVTYSHPSKSNGQDYGNWTMFYVPSWDRTYLYAHTMHGQSMVNIGDKLAAGALVTLSGNTGLSTGPHLHLTVAKGKHTTFSSLSKAAINFEKDVVTVEDESQPTPEPTPEPVFKPYQHTIVGGSTLYKRDGTAQEIETTSDHVVTIIEEVGNLGRFKASWLKGVTESYTDLSDNDSVNYVGKNVTIKAGSVLYDANGNAEEIKITSEKTVTVISQIGDGINPNTLLNFKASWLIGVTNSYAKVSTLK